MAFSLSVLENNASAAEQVNETNQMRENLEKIELYQMIDSNLREIGLSLELLSKTQIDFENMEHDLPITDNYMLSKKPKDEIVFEETTKYMAIDDYAKKRYGNNATEEERMKMYLLYYFDVYDDDKAASRVGPNLDMEFYCPNYMGENDERAYQNFIKTTYGGNLMKEAKNTTQLINDGAGLEKVSIKKLIKSHQSIKARIEEIKKSNDIAKFLQDSIKYMSDDGLKNIKTTDGFIAYWEESLSKTPGERIDEETTKNIKELVIYSLFDIYLQTPSEIVSKIVDYTASTVALSYLTIYDQAAINTLAYTRGTRVAFRQYESWW